MAQLVLPRVQAMVLCDDIEESDQEDEVVQLTGVRAAIELPSFPAVRSQLCVYLQISGHQGEALCHIQIESIERDEVIYKTESLVIIFEDPTTIVPVYFRLPNCVFSTTGVYYVQVFNESKLICERPLRLRQEE